MPTNRRFLRRPAGLKPQVPVATFPDWWATQQHALHEGFAYCITNCSNPKHVQELIEDLVRKTTAPYEIVLWVESLAADFERFLAHQIWAGVPIFVAERSLPKSTIIRELFPFCQRSWVMQIDCDTPKMVEGYNPKVSIIIPTYKRQHVLLRTINSILEQSYSNWELIIVNNEVGGILPGLPNDSRIFVYNHHEEANACYARNMGVGHATGDLVNFFDDDDEMLPGYLEKMAAPFSDPKVMVVRCGMLCTFGACDFSYSTQEAWLRRAYATPTWQKGSLVHDQVYYRSMIERNGWKKENILQLGEVLVKAYTEPSGGIRAGGY